MAILRVISVSLAVAAGVANAEPIVPGLRDGLDPVFAGRVLLSELNCAACHSGAVPVKGAPDLTSARGRIHRDYLEEFIADPQATKPGTTMPEVLGALSAGERREAAKALADYIESLGDDKFKIEPIDAEAVDRGRGLFEKIGCVACHSPEGKTLAGSPPLHRLGDKYSLGSLGAFLENPLAVRPGGRMPNMHLSHWEAIDLASYLLRDQTREAAVATHEEGRVEEGRELFVKYGCAQCHQPGEAVPDFAKTISELDGTQPCGAVDFSLSPRQQEQVAAACKNVGAAPDPAMEIRLMLARLNCIACHRRDDFGGPLPERDFYFTTSNLNLGEQARLPPDLTHVGAKLTSNTLRKVIIGGESVRPYMNTRMPGFGVSNVVPLLELLTTHDRLPQVEFERVNDEKVAREAGQQLVGDKNLACIACHTFKGESATTLAGLEMTGMAERLQENWFHLYLRNPQEFHPTTIMPGFWPGGKSVRPELLDGDPGKQIDAIWQYLARGREARTPSGIRREPLEYGPIDGEAVMLRRQYQGIGKRGIGVGYPTGINLSFDAGQGRLGSLWRGGFAEMSGVWRGQGSGNVGERSREVVRFPAGPAFARLESPLSEWPLVEQGTKAPGIHWQGYSLDLQQRPTFRYRFESLGIADEFADHVDGPSLIRTLVLEAPAPENLYFRAAADENLKASSEGDNSFDLSRGLRLTLDGKGIIRTAGALKELIVPLSGRQSLTIEYTFPPE
jgi:mono/diheme cytochrome c family protein